MINIAPADNSTLDCLQWSAKINAIHSEVQAGFFRIGEALIEAKAGLPHGEFQAMIASDLNFSDGYARSFMRVARCDWLSERKDSSDLPQAFDTLQVLAKLEPDELALLEGSGEITRTTTALSIRGFIKKRDRGARELKLGQNIRALPTKKYGLLYVDNEWRFEPRTEKGQDRAAANHYPTSTLLEIQLRKVRDIVADDCIAAVWATSPMLIEAICVLDAWGFMSLDRDPKTGFLTPDKSQARYVSDWIWLKHKISTGYWGRNQHEHLLIATRGKPVAPAEGTQLSSMFDIEPVAAEARAGDHSVKPDLFRDYLTKQWPNTPKIELNYRGDVAPDGWDVWGYEAPEMAAE